MTDNKIVKALECCYKDGCKECPLLEYKGDCFQELIKHNVLDLINRQKAEIERYKGVIKILEADVKAAREEAVKDFGHLLIDKSKNGIIYASDIPDYVKEMKGE